MPGVNLSILTSIKKNNVYWEKSLEILESFNSRKGILIWRKKDIFLLGNKSNYIHIFNSLQATITHSGHSWWYLFYSSKLKTTEGIFWPYLLAIWILRCSTSWYGPAPDNGSVRFNQRNSRVAQFVIITKLQNCFQLSGIFLIIRNLFLFKNNYILIFNEIKAVLELVLMMKGKKVFSMVGNTVKRNGLFLKNFKFFGIRWQDRFKDPLTQLIIGFEALF